MNCKSNGASLAIEFEFEDEDEDEHDDEMSATQPAVFNANDTAEVSSGRSKRRRAY
jgi:hypothetical protein